jgi:hypothetical protein
MLLNKRKTMLEITNTKMHAHLTSELSIKIWLNQTEKPSNLKQDLKDNYIHKEKSYKD